MVDPSGDDLNSGSIDAPWRTVGKAAASVQAGDSVSINPGTYQESVWLVTSGQPDAPIVFRFEPGAVLMSPDPAASFEAFNIAGASYV